jgi:hypothetical protein
MEEERVPSPAPDSEGEGDDLRAGAPIDSSEEESENSEAVRSKPFAPFWTLF